MFQFSRLRQLAKGRQESFAAASEHLPRQEPRQAGQVWWLAQRKRIHRAQILLQVGIFCIEAFMRF